MRLYATCASQSQVPVPKLHHNLANVGCHGNHQRHYVLQLLCEVLVFPLHILVILVHNLNKLRQSKVKSAESQESTASEQAASEQASKQQESTASEQASERTSISKQNDVIQTHDPP